MPLGHREGRYTRPVAAKARIHDARRGGELRHGDFNAAVSLAPGLGGIARQGLLIGEPYGSDVLGRRPAADHRAPRAVSPRP